MKPDKKIVWDLGNGEVAVTTPNAPMLGQYVISDGVAEQVLFTVSEGAPMLNKTIAILDRMVIAGEVKFDPAETEQEYLDRRIEYAKRKIPALVSANVSAIVSAVVHDELDRDFPNALDVSGKPSIEKCKAIAHNRRRQMREAEFRPHDDVIAKQIPGMSVTEAEAARQSIRDKYDAMQRSIDGATTVNQIKSALL